MSLVTPFLDAKVNKVDFMPKVQLTLRNTDGLTLTLRIKGYCRNVDFRRGVQFVLGVTFCVCACAYVCVCVCEGLFGMRPLRSLVTSVPGHFGPETDLYIHFGPWSYRSSDTSVLRTELT